MDIWVVRQAMMGNAAVPVCVFQYICPHISVESQLGVTAGLHSGCAHLIFIAAAKPISK